MKLTASEKRVLNGLSFNTDDYKDKISFFEGVFAYDTFTPCGKVFVCLIITLLLSIASQVGDLVASKLKRAYGIKDYSQVFPGHGGVLDRFDSVLFASAIFLLFIIIEMNFIDVLQVNNNVLEAIKGI